MAFCGNCGTQLSDGVQFCPKCGQPVNGNGTNNVQNPVTNNCYVDEPEEQQIKTWQKIVSVLLWPAGAILIIAALIKKQQALAKSALMYTAIGLGLSIGLNIALGGCANEHSQQVESIDSSEYEYEDGDADYEDVAEVGYKCGYEMGFGLGGSPAGDYFDGTENIQIYYTNYYPAPTTPDEKRQYKVFAENFTRGFKKGKKAAK